MKPQVLDTFGAASLAIRQRQIDVFTWAVAAAKEQPPRPVEPSSTTTPNPVVSAATAPSSISDVMQCIKDHESGNYAESSHPSSGSGAYQYVPGTWQYWSEQAGYPGYEYAYQAPPEVQDAVTVHVLTHGGAGNWSPKYGDDPCTVGMGG